MTEQVNSEQAYYIYQCLKPSCRFRFPGNQTDSADRVCPKCGSPMQKISWLPPASQEFTNNRNEQHIEILLDNIRSVFNVGSIFRTADGAGVDHIHLCGITPAPDHPKIQKTALGAQLVLPWTQHWNSLEVIEHKKREGYQIWCLEGGQGSVPIFAPLQQLNALPLLLVLGSETTGIDPDLRKQCDYLVNLPMLGIKESLNVATAFGIAVYLIRFYPQLRNVDTFSSAS